MKLIIYIQLLLKVVKILIVLTNKCLSCVVSQLQFQIFSFNSEIFIDAKIAKVAKYSPHYCSNLHILTKFPQGLNFLQFSDAKNAYVKNVVQVIFRNVYYYKI